MDEPGEWGIDVERLGQFTFYSVIGRQEEFAWVGSYAEGDGATRYMLGVSDGTSQDYSSEYLAHETALGVAMDLRDTHMHLDFRSNQIDVIDVGSEQTVPRDASVEALAAGLAPDDARQLGVVRQALMQIVNYASQVSHHIPGDFQQIIGLAYAAQWALNGYMGGRDV